MANQEHLDILKQGVQTWNQWREGYPDIELDFDGANLSKAALSGANLSHANLSKANFRGANLSHADLTRADLSEANLSGANLVDAYLGGAHLRKADLTGADLSHADLMADLTGADLSDAHLVDANLIGANLVDANLQLAYLSDADLSLAHLTRADLTGVDLSGANLSGANLVDAELQLAYLSDANLSKADLSGSHLTGADLSSADLSDANLSHTNLSHTNLSHAILREANLSDARIPYIQYLDRKYDQNTSKWKRFQLWLYPHSIMRGKYQGIRVASCYGNAIFKRDAEDQDFLDTLEEHWEKTWRIWLFRAWGLIDYGRSMLAVFVIAFLIVVGFGAIYLIPGTISYGKNDNTLFSPFYFSIVTFTTLGFGDVTPNGGIGEIIVSLQVIFGYLTLGLLISILANKVARRG